MTIDLIIDLSHWNDPVDFVQVQKAGIVAIIAKATNGAVGVDRTYAAYRAAAAGLSFLWGSYHFGTGDDVHAQVAHYLDVAKPAPDELLCLDFEPNPHGSSMSLNQAREFVSLVRQRIARYPVLYAGHTLKEALAGRPDDVLSRCPLWLAQYGPSAVLPPGWDHYTLWQFTDGNVGDPPHTVNGVGACDRSRFAGSEADLRQQWPFEAT